MFYNYLINTFSKEYAKGYLDANEQAIHNIKSIIDEEQIDCDFEFQDSYIYTDLEDEIVKIKHEVLAINSLGFDAEYVDKIDVPFNTLAGIKFKNQAQFNPLKYVYGLCKSILNSNGEIYEDSKVYDIKTSLGGCTTYTKNNTVHSKYIVLASHYPIINVPGFYFLKMYQEASYIIGVETNSPLFNGMYINTKSPTTSFRVANYNSKKILLVCGSEHKVGVKEDLSNCYTNLEKVAKSLYADSKVLFRWQTR